MTDTVDAYVAELAASLRGPRRLRADLLAEACDGLADAVRTHEESGVDRATAERAAVAEFGAVSVIARDYQRVLGMSQGRRTALVLFGVSALESLLPAQAWRLAGMDWGGVPPAYRGLADLVTWNGAAAVVVGLLVFFACGVGERHGTAHPWVPRALAVFALCWGVLATGPSLLLGAVSSSTTFDSLPHLAWLAVLGALPVLWVVSSARRCLVASVVPGRPASRDRSPT